MNNNLSNSGGLTPDPQTGSLLNTDDLDVEIPVQNEQDNLAMENLQKTVIALPQEASDSDLIEKEWVGVLQEIVSRTTSDPYTQQSEISKIKADYMKKRYNKDIKQGG